MRVSVVKCGRSIVFSPCSVRLTSAQKRPTLTDLFVNLASSSEIDKFIAQNRAGLLKTLQHRLLTTFTSTSDFDVNGMLDIYPLHLFTTDQLVILLRHAEEKLSVNTHKKRDFGSLTILDVGSGVGTVTDELRGVSKSVVTTEMSPEMCSRLRARGYECWNEDIASTYTKRLNEGRRFNLVSLLNVIDRTPRPLSMLHASRELMSPDGLLLLATPLPFRPFYFTSNHPSAATSSPAESLNTSPALPHSIHPAGSRKSSSSSSSPKYGKPLEVIRLPENVSWEDQAASLIHEVLPTAGFRVVAFSRLPYISGGDFFKEYTALDDIILVAEKEQRNPSCD
jgi:2-polyprenyl-3-methyl-5-hydroxy-6-metoxy-1,4-benzoquinol methylase